LAKVVIECVQDNSGCVHGHKKGDRIVINGTRIEGDICLSALNSMYYMIYALKTGAKLDYAADDGKITACCTDAENLVIFKLWGED
jgi:uncharacterized repeat protein (TIGR04076 family)